MKKIVAVASLAALLAGATFAADISFSYTGNNYFTSNSKAGVKYNPDLRGDCISFGLSNDYAGAVVDFDLDLTDADSITLDEYYGWMNFEDISTQFTAGVWNSRYADDVTTDAGDLDGEDFILWDMGLLPVGDYSVAVDSGNLTDGNIAMVAAYTNENLLPGKMMLKFGLVNSDWDSFTKTDSDGKYTRTNSYGFVGEFALRQENAFDVNLAIKSLHVGQYSFGLFFSPLMIENLELTAGLSLGLDTYTYSERNGNAKDESAAEFAFDIRARYAVTEKFSITTAHNISSYIAGLDTEKNDGSLADNKMAMANQINATYAFLENMSFGLNLQHVIEDFDNAYPSNVLYITPSVAIKATEKATVTIAARAEWDNIGWQKGAEDFGFTLPVIFSYNY